MQYWTQTILLRTLSLGRCSRQFHLEQVVLIFIPVKQIKKKSVLESSWVWDVWGHLWDELNLSVSWTGFGPAVLDKLTPLTFPSSLLTFPPLVSLFHLSVTFPSSNLLSHPILYFPKSQDIRSVLAYLPAGGRDVNVGVGGAGPVLEACSFSLG